MPKGVYTGSKVRLLHDVETKGGIKFKAGCVMFVNHAHRGGLDLSCYKRGWTQWIRCVSSKSVVVVEWGPDEDEDTDDVPQ